MAGIARCGGGSGRASPDPNSPAAAQFESRAREVRALIGRRGVTWCGLGRGRGLPALGPSLQTATCNLMMGFALIVQ